MSPALVQLRSRMQFIEADRKHVAGGSGQHRNEDTHPS
jgi:hypothetical protein